jgi:peptidyl-prolyl cis-trans isomerase SurA
MRKIGLVVLSIVLFTTVASAQKKMLDKIAAVVGSNIILHSDLELQYSLYLSNGNAPNPAIKCQILQGLISQKLLTQQAVIDSIEVKEDEVDNEMDRRMRRMVQQAGTQEKLEQYLGRSLLQYKEEVRPDIKEGMIADRMRAKITEKINVTPQDVKKYFDAMPKDSLPTFNKEVEVGEIVFEPKLNKEEKEFARQKAQDLLDRVKKGEDFGTLATAYSQDPGSASQGGDYGFIDRNTMVKEFTAWAFKLKAGEISPVFETDFGFHFLQVLERRGENAHVRHILIMPTITEESVNRAKLKADTVYNLLTKNNKVSEAFAYAASVYSDEKETKYNGGLLMNGDNQDTRTTYIPTDRLDPQIAVIIDTMKVGGLSKPVMFRAQQGGKTSYRLFYLKSVIDAHKANLAQDLPKLKAAATNDKTNRTVSAWFEKKRKENFIKIDPSYQSCPGLQGWSTPKTATAQINK